MSAHVEQLKLEIPHPPASTEEKLSSARVWRDLADEQERGAAMGFIHPKVATYNASLYRRTARAIEVELETGQAVCVCCFKPFGRGALHQ